MPDTQAPAKALLLDALYEDYSRIPMLQQVADGRPTVRGYGPLNAPVMIVAEAPGEQEEKQGRPLVGPSGQLLQAMLAQAGVSWNLCYRANVLPWRPRNNRTPYPFEIDHSMDRVQAEICIIAPTVLIAAGAVAWQAITRKQHGPAGEHRGRWMKIQPAGTSGFTCDLLAIYHPSALLQAPRNLCAEMKAETMAALMSILEGERAR